MRELLPIEVAECIIDASRTSPRSLSACSLVCRSWLPRTRYHLFSSLDLSADWAPEPNAVTDFMEILTGTSAGSDSSSVPCCAATVTLVPYVTCVVLAKRSWGMTPVQTILAVLARAGIRPEILQINCPAYELRSSSPQSVGFGFPFAPSLVHLALQLHNDTFLDALVDHICSFPKLQSLEITGSARVTVREDAWPKTTALPQNLRRLVLAYPEILDWVITSGRIPSTVDQMVIRDLETSPQWASVSRFLASEQAEGLSSLEFQNCNMDHLHSAIAPYVPSLQHLSIELFPAAPPLSASTALIRLFTTFRGMASSLEILTLFAPTLAAFDDTEWDRLDSLFTQSHSLSLPLSQPFPALSRLRLRVRVRSPRTRDLAYDYGLPTPYVHRISAQMGAWSKGSVVLDF